MPETIQVIRVLRYTGTRKELEYHMPKRWVKSDKPVVANGLVIEEVLYHEGLEYTETQNA